MGFLSAILPAIPGIASVAGSTFGKKKESGKSVPSQVGLPNFQVQAGRQLSDFVQKFLPLFEPGKEFEGLFNAPLSEFENRGLADLKAFQKSPISSPLLDAARQTTLDTVGGKFADPDTSPFIQSMINLSKINLRDAIDESRARRGGRGSFFTEAALREEGDITNKSLAFLDTIVGDFINKERGRQQAAVPIAQQLDQFSRLTEPLTRIGASQELGKLPRLIDQANLESEYQDFLRKQKELGGVVETAGDLFGQSTPFSPGFQEPGVEKNTTLGNILEIISKLNLGNLNTSGGIGGILKSLPSILQLS